MKTLKFLSVLLIINCLMLNFSCSKDDDSVDPDSNNEDYEPERLPGISLDDVETYEGDIGFNIDVRSLAKKGYQITDATISFSTSQTDYSEDETINVFLNKIQVKLSVENLSNTDEEELREGVPVEIKLYNGSSLVVTYNSTNMSFVDNGTPISITGPNFTGPELDEIHEELYFKEGMPHFLQTVDENGNYSNLAVEKSSGAGANTTILYEDISTFSSSWTNHQYYFYKYPSEENMFAIYNRHTNNYLGYNVNTNLIQSGSLSYPTTDPNSLSNQYRFRIKKEPNGLYSLNYIDNDLPYRRRTNPYNGQLEWRFIGSDLGSIQYFRVVALDLEWAATDIGTEALPLIYPRPQTSLGFNHTILNCGDGLYSGTVGFSQTESREFQATTTEKIGISSRETSSGEVSVTASATANFFAGESTIEGTTTASLEIETEVTQETSNSQTAIVGDTKEVRWERTITVPSGSSSLVYDATQTYNNVIFPYVKRLRLRASQIDPSNNAFIGTMTGNEIATQLRMSNFNGIITLVGSDFIEISIEGQTILNNFVEGYSTVEDANLTCN